MAKMFLTLLAILASSMSVLSLKCYQSPQVAAYVDITPNPSGGHKLEDYPWGWTEWRGMQLSEADNHRYPGIPLPAKMTCNPGENAANAGPVAGIDEGGTCTNPYANGTDSAGTFPGEDKLYCWNKATVLEVLTLGTPDGSVPADHAAAAASQFLGFNVQVGTRVWLRDSTLIGCNIGSHTPYQSVSDDLTNLDCSHKEGTQPGTKVDFSGALDCTTNTHSYTIGGYECAYCFIPNVFYMFGNIKYFTVQCRCNGENYGQTSTVSGQGYDTAESKHTASDISATTSSGVEKTWTKGDYCNVEMLSCIGEKFRQTFSNQFADPTSYLTSASDFASIPDKCRTHGEKWTAEMLKRSDGASFMESDTPSARRKMVRSENDKKKANYNPNPIFHSAGLPSELWQDHSEHSTGHAKISESNAAPHGEAMTATFKSNGLQEIRQKDSAEATKIGAKVKATLAKLAKHSS